MYVYIFVKGNLRNYWCDYKNSFTNGKVQYPERYKLPIYFTAPIPQGWRPVTKLQASAS